MSIVKILALDPGTANLGYSMLCGNTDTSEVYLTKHFGVLHTSKWEGESEVKIRERIDALGGQVNYLVKQLDPTHFVMEDFVEQGKFIGKTYKEMAYITEHLRLVSRELGVPATIYPNGEWKKLTLKAMRANKIQVQHYIAHKVPEAAKLLVKQPDHVWDSVGIGYCKWLEIVKVSNQGVTK